jgi:hypothetical protein
MAKSSAPSTQESLLSVPFPAKLSATENKPSLKETLEIASKSLIGLAGLCYVLGLIVVAMHLRRYGLNSLSLSQLHYITAGVWVILPVLLGLCYCVIVKVFYDGVLEGILTEIAKAEKAKDAEITSAPTHAKEPDSAKPTVDEAGAVPPGRVKKLFRGAKSISNRPEVRSILMAMLMSTVLFVIGVKAIIDKLELQLSWRSWLWIPLLGTTTFTLTAVIIFKVATGRIKQAKGFLALPFFAVIIGMFGCVWYVSVFSAYTYEEIPWSTGGGRASLVRLVIANEEKEPLKDSGIHFEQLSNQTIPLKLLLATENEYLIITEGGQTMSVPTKSVKSVIYEK